MAFPSTVISDLISGVVGEVAFDAPTRALTAVINSAAAANNVFGRALTYRDAAVETVQAGGTGVFAGIMINPKTHYRGTIDDNANAVANGYTVEGLVEGYVFVELSTDGVIGDPVYFVNATGVLGAGEAAEGQTQIPGAVVARHNVSVAQPRLAVIHLNVPA